MTRISSHLTNSESLQECDSTFKQWRPAFYISNQHRQNSVARGDSSNPYALLLLNQPISNSAVFSEICCGAQYIVCADGGANRLRELHLSSAGRDLCELDAICGDLDSIQDDVKDYYQRQGTAIIKDPDQHSTDFTKCLKHISSKYEDIIGEEHIIKGSQGPNPHGLDVAVMGGLCGRADQAFSQLHHLYAAAEDPSLLHGDIYLITPESVIFVLERGLNIIHTPVASDLLAENVGIIPLGRPSIITTRGLAWDVKDWATEIGGKLSTSNHIRCEIIEIETSERVVFTVELAQKP
ncbi:MAG: hypothetical protein M1830_006870 [Pleopsidium flavum]|nr:MAG: hypothetical protein M1830_006870 [Pleopsidium flavum]